MRLVDGDSSSVRSLYHEDYYGAMAPANCEYFCKHRGAALLPNRLKGLARVKLEPGMTVLDVGCGRGELCIYCALRGLNAVGVDFASTAIAIGQELIEQFQIRSRTVSYVSLICADGCRLPFDDESFDRIMSFAFLEHIELWQAELFVDEAKRVLRPNGVLVICTGPNELPIRLAHGVFRPFANWLLHSKLPNYSDRIATERSGGHLHLWNPFSLQRLLAKYSMPCYVRTFADDYAAYPSLASNVRRIGSRINCLSPFLANDMWAIAAKSQHALRKFVAKEDCFVPQALLHKTDGEVLRSTAGDQSQPD